MGSRLQSLRYLKQVCNREKGGRSENTALKIFSAQINAGMKHLEMLVDYVDFDTQCLF